MAGLAKSLSIMAKDLGDALDGYDKGKHYMRGPGPKWHAKHGSSQQQDGSDSRLVVAPGNDVTRVSPDALGALLSRRR